jgi:hypothetical protein
VRPYSHIPRCDLKPKDHINHRRAKVVAQYLEQQVLKAEPRLLPEGVRQIRQLRPADNDRIFEVVYDTLLRRLYDPDSADLTRKVQTTYNTVYEYIRKHNVIPSVLKKRKRSASAQ